MLLVSAATYLLKLRLTKIQWHQLTNCCNTFVLPHIQPAHSSLLYVLPAAPGHSLLFQPQTDNLSPAHLSASTSTAAITGQPAKASVATTGHSLLLQALLLALLPALLLALPLIPRALQLSSTSLSQPLQCGIQGTAEDNKYV
jgi:hypothetical protein